MSIENRVLLMLQSNRLVRLKIQIITITLKVITFNEYRKWSVDIFILSNRFVRLKIYVIRIEQNRVLLMLQSHRFIKNLDY